ncbi:MAG: ABC transporter permease subunit [Desulfovibrio sp.]|uniref:nickel/cobalt ABC transporter permease n=1 Tax=Desulfovibrio sp. TaxID=885 RepID=UPI0039E5FC8C
MMWKALRQDRMAMCCMAFLVLVAAAALFAPWLAPYDPTVINVKDKFAHLSFSHPLGTDQLGRDVLSRLMWGGRATLGFSLLAMLLTVFVGTLLGLVAGFFRGKVDEAIMRLCDAMMSFPSEVMILAIVGMLGPGLGNIVIASVIAKWPWYTRMIRSTVMQYSDMNYVRFSRVAGCSTLHIFRKHLLPGAAGEIVVLATLDTGSVILAVSALSFLGLGVQPPTPEWGAMLSDAKDIMSMYPQQMLPPGLLILLIVAAFNFLGDGLRDALDPAHTTAEGVRI